ncbi:putative protein C6orf15 [Galemys pyrenaicus]|uniref:Uncharacterized protein n=1 Tax=Galemys pyrenaicus TaxID=202257 RepID=A0A8J6DMD4_GALPY|nr:putative protein C6orf15 [Galemys pyrenaicus]
MLTLSKMQGRMVRSWAPLAVLLVCLHLPGLPARSIGAAEEKAPQDLETNLLLPGQSSSTGPSNSEQPQSKPEPESNDLRSVPLNPKASQSDGSQPAGAPGVQSWLSWGLPHVDSWTSEDPWQMTATGDEDYVGEALPQNMYFFSNNGDLPPGSDPSPAASSEHPTGAQPETSLSQKDPDSNQSSPSNMGAQGETSAQRPFWNLINRIRQSLLPGRPCGLLKPRGPLGGSLKLLPVTTTRHKGLQEPQCQTLQLRSSHTDGASVHGVLADFHFLHHLPEGGTKEGPVFTPILAVLVPLAASCKLGSHPERAVMVMLLLLLVNQYAVEIFLLLLLLIRSEAGRPLIWTEETMSGGYKAEEEIVYLLGQGSRPSATGNPLCASPTQSTDPDSSRLVREGVSLSPDYGPSAGICLLLMIQNGNQPPSEGEASSLT